MNALWPDALVPILGVLIVCGAVILVLRLLDLRFVQVPEEERFIIYRGGRFNRIVGPGYAPLIGAMERVERQYNVTELPRGLTTHELFLDSHRFRYRLELWYRTDLAAATANQPNAHELQRKLAAIDEDARLVQLRNIVTEETQTAVQKVVDERPSGTNTHVDEQILHILPGLPDAVRIVEIIEPRLRERLPQIGLILRTGTAITIRQLQPEASMLDELTSARALSLLRRRFPHLSGDVAADLLSSVGASEPNRSGAVSLETSGVAAATGSRGDRDSTHSMPGQRRPSVWESQAASGEDYRLTAEDVAVLKAVPRTD